MSLRKAAYRIRQGLHALAAYACPVDYDRVAGVLTPPLMTLFHRMRRSEQQHSLRVMDTLLEAGHDDPDLLTAALLHDCGKSRHRFGLVGRVLVVLARRAAPALLTRWSQGEPRGLRRPFVIAAQHPAWSAEDMAACGASPLAVELARRHQEKLAGPPRDRVEHLLALLQAADDSQ
ncbi:MAG: HDIG domain-containing protein [Anaerolineae bacterium]